MSIQALAWVLEESEATLADRLVLLAIANHADARGWNAYPSVPLIAHEARVDRATVFRAITGLEELGELTVRRRPGRPNLYGITAMTGSQDATGEGSQDATGGVASTRQRGRRMRPEPSVTVNEPSRARAQEPRPVPAWVPNGALGGPTEDQRATGLRAIREILRKDPEAT